MTDKVKTADPKIGLGKIDIYTVIKLLVAGVVLIIILYAVFGSKEENSSANVYSVGQSFDVEDVTFRVNEIKTIEGPKSNRLVVSYTATNNGKEEITLGTNGVKLTDNRDRSFEPDNILGGPGSLNPGISGDGEVEFEIPKDASGLVVSLRADMFDFGGADYGSVKVP